MATKRTPINREQRRRITPEAIEAFRRIKKVEGACTCPPRDWGGEYWKHEPSCDACSEWSAAESVLSKELALRPWEWPAVLHPDAQCPFPAGSYAAERWHREKDEDAIARYREMEEALARLGEAKATRASDLKSPEPVVGVGAGIVPGLKGR